MVDYFDRHFPLREKTLLIKLYDYKKYTCHLAALDLTADTHDSHSHSSFFSCT